MKLRVHSTKYATTLLASRGFAISRARHFEVNLIFDSPDSGLRGTGRLLRLREADGRAIITFKGIAESGRHKVREEIEVGVEDFEAARQIFERIGFLPKFRYEKYRTEYKRLGDPGVVVLDETPIGDFLEIEGPGEWIDSMARRLGFEDTQYILDSYGRLYLDWCTQRGVPPTDMIFRDAQAEPRGR